MGVDYYSCAGCSFGFRDDDERVSYCECGNHFCNSECGKLQNYGDWNEETESHRVYDDLDITCKICRKETANDYVLFEALLAHYSITREDAFEIYKKQK